MVLQCSVVGCLEPPLVVPGFLVFVAEYESHACLRDSGLPLLIHQLLQVSHPHLRQVRDAQDETDGVQDVGFPAAVQPRDRVKALVEALEHRPRGVRLEAIDHNLSDMHGRLGYNEQDATAPQLTRRPCESLSLSLLGRFAPGKPWPYPLLHTSRCGMRLLLSSLACPSFRLLCRFAKPPYPAERCARAILTTVPTMTHGMRDCLPALLVWRCGVGRATAP